MNSNLIIGILILIFCFYLVADIVVKVVTLKVNQSKNKLVTQEVNLDLQRKYLSPRQAETVTLKDNYKKKKVVAVSGYFNPIHSGHIEMFNEAKKLGDELVVIINNDYQVELKGTVPFMNAIERKKIVENIKSVDKAFISLDMDKTVCLTLEALNPDIFANGGDRKNENDIPETTICKANNIQMVFNVGGDKVNSSSELIKKATNFLINQN